VFLMQARRSPNPSEPKSDKKIIIKLNKMGILLLNRENNSLLDKIVFLKSHLEMLIIAQGKKCIHLTLIK